MGTNRLLGPFTPSCSAMSQAYLSTVFQRFSTLNIGVIGDFALDLYFGLNTQTGEYSLETDKEVFQATKPTASLGAAGNVVHNLIALGVAQIWAIGCVGNDLFGRDVQYLLRSLGVSTEHLHVQTNHWDTCVYAKPSQHGQEANRIDFGTNNKLEDAAFRELMVGLEQLLPTLDVLIINQQFANPLLSGERVEALNQLILRYPDVRYVADMRDAGMRIQAAMLKVNTTELAKFLGVHLPEQPTLDWCIKQGNALVQQRTAPLLITQGADGMLYMNEAGDVQSVAGLPLTGPLDTVGAGDTVVAAWAASIGAGATSEHALTIANLAAAVTVQKLAQTGTASLDEINTLYNTYYTHD